MVDHDDVPPARMVLLFFSGEELLADEDHEEREERKKKGGRPQWYDSAETNHRFEEWSFLNSGSFLRHWLLLLFLTLSTTWWLEGTRSKRANETFF